MGFDTCQKGRKKIQVKEIERLFLAIIDAENREKSCNKG